MLVGVPLAASADIGGFELDGNAASNGAADWDGLGSDLFSTGVITDGTGVDERGFTTGGSKDTNDVSQWKWTDGTVTPAKDDIQHAYAAVYAEQGNLVLYFGQDRALDKNGDANVGFWFLQGSVGQNDDGTFSGSHVDGDVLVQSEFTNGGDVSGVQVYKWQGGASGGLSLIVNQAECTDNKLGTKQACAIVNKATIPTSWTDYDITSPYFFEGGLNLSSLFEQSVPCFSTFLTNTRTSQSESAQLKDFAMGDIDTCGSIEITKIATPSDGTEFDYSTSPNLSPSSFKLSDSATRTYDKLGVGQYSVTEAQQTGSWAFDNLSCPTQNNGSAQISGQTATITLGFLGNVKCTYVNKRKPQVRVVKALEPANDPGKFNLQINGTTQATDVGNGGDTGYKEVAPGQQVTVGELAGTGTNLANYVSDVSCDSSKGGSQTTSHSFTANFGDKVTCTITNRRKPEVKVVKVIEPANDAGKFNLLVNGNVELANAGNGGDTGYKQVAVGAVTVGESAGTATSLGNYNSKVECDAGKGSTNPGTSHGFTVSYGDRVICTITNTRKATLTVIKNVIEDNGGTKVASDFAISVTGSSPSPASFAGAGAPGTVVTIGPGEYNVTETEDPGYAASYSAGCTGNLPAGGSATCTITNNDKPATLTVIKHVVNDNGGTATASNFTMTIGGVTAAGGNSFAGSESPGVTKTLTSLGSFNVTESSVSGYTQTSAVGCSGTIALGESKTCTITNDDQAATLIVKKVVVNDNGGTKGPSDFSFQVNGQAAVSFEADGQNDLTVPAGTYNVVEPAVTGYTTTYQGCSNVVIPNGGTATCTVTNNDQPATLIVKKVVVNDNGGTRVASDFSFQVNGQAAVSFEADGQNDLSVPAGTYSVTEPAVAGYTTSYSNCSDIVIPNGGSATCTVTNNDQAATLIVIKHVVNDNGGTAVSGDFQMTVDDTGSNPPSFPGAEAPGNSVPVDPGTYSVSESGPGGYTMSQSAGCSGSIALGETKTCTVTNDDQQANLVVIKHVVNDNGGSAVSGDFQMTVDDTGPNPPSFPGAEAPGTSVPVDPGTYSVSESGPGGYTMSQSAGCSGSIALGQTKTCTVTNDDNAPKLTLVKQVVNDNGGTAVASAWNLAAAGPTGFNGAGPSVSSGAGFDAGSYNLSESGPVGYAASAWVCSKGQVDGDTVTVGLGDEITCTITNDDRPATLIVKKVVVNDNGGTSTAADFSFQVNGAAAQAFEADGQNDLTVAAGTYNVTEVAKAGYTTTYQGCAQIVLPLGGSATCTITNNDVPRGQGSLTVSKSADPTTIKEPGGPVTFSVTITNTSADIVVTVDNVVDDKFGDLDDDGGNGCFDVPINLAPGGKVNCTFQKTISGNGGTSHVNVVTVSGHDAGGHSLTASDDARVDITPRLIDLVIVKDASSPTPLNGIVNYSLKVTNKGPDTATNVQLADPAPAGITYLTANPSQGTCNLSSALITCSLGNIAPGQTVTIAITGRATVVGSHTNTATVTGSGGRETNPADNVDDAVTVVPAPLKPPTVKPEPAPAVCLTLTVTPKMLKADGKPDRVTAKVTAAAKRVNGAKVSIAGAGVKKTGRTNGKGVAVLRINPKKPGIITITVVESNQKLCGPKRIGVVGVFLPPLTG